MWGDKTVTAARILTLSSVVVMASCTAAAVIEGDLPWWKTAVLYQVYPRSFKDSNGDGVGDLKGITDKADYFKDLGVTAIWISPMFKSPMADFGYDISDFRLVDPVYGTGQDFRDLLRKIQSLDIKLLLDLVPNHSSDEHEWFQKSVQRVDPYTDYYVWSDGKIDPETNQRIPPNNWVSMFGGPAWEWNEQRQQYYYHQFGKKQPDLNYRNPRVLREMDDVMRFWLDLGVDGFRVDAVPFLMEDDQLRDEPVFMWGGMDHVYTQNLPETHQVLSHWADLVYNYTLEDGKARALYAEAYADLAATIKYYGNGNLNLMQPFNFQLMASGNQSIRASKMKELILSWLDIMPKGNVANWVLGNHDNPRVADRYGSELIDGLNILTGVLPGSKVTYYGEEIGMRNTFVRWDQTVDPTGRDPERTPMQWDNTVSAGFSTNQTTWLPVNPNYWWLNVMVQQAIAKSHLKVFRAVNDARKDPVFVKGELNVLDPDEDTLLVVRSLEKSYCVFIFNMGSEIVEYTSQNLFGPQDLDMDYTVVVASINSRINAGTVLGRGLLHINLRPKAAVLLKSN